jgi:hypothetical protein
LPALLATCAAGAAAKRVGAVVVYDALNLTISSAGPSSSATVTLPAIGVPPDDNKNALTFTATTSNGVQVTKPTAAGSASVNVTTQGSYPYGTAPVNTLITAIPAGGQIAYLGESGPWSLNFGDTLLAISADGSTGQFTVASGPEYFGINYTSGSGTYNGWVAYQTLSVGSTVSGRISGIAMESTPYLPIVAGNTGGGAGGSGISWASDASGAWSTGSNWTGGAAPSGAGVAATLGPVISQPRTVSLTADTTIGSLTFNSASSYAVSGASSLILSSGSSASASISVVAGSHSISAPVVIASDLSVGVPTGSRLSVATLDGGRAVTLSGGGVLAVSTRLDVASLTVGSTSLLDLGRGEAVFSGMTESAVRALVVAWRNAGFGLGSTAGDPLATLAVITNDDGTGAPLYSTFDGVAVSATDVLVKYTYFGDTDLNGYVDANDLANLLAGMSGNLTGWANGDFDYSGTVDSTDLSLLLASLGGQGAPYGNPGGTSGAVPEPSSLALLALGAAGLARYRDRSLA